MSKFFKATAQNDTAVMYMYGMIGFGEITTTMVKNAINGFKGKYKKLDVYVNSKGGEVPEGLAIWDEFERSDMEISFYVTGMAASMMAALIMFPGAKVYMNRFSKVMLHSLQGAVVGTVKEVESYLEQMKDFESDLIDIVAERTGKGSEEVNAEYFDGIDHWLNLKQATKAGIVDGEYKGNVIKKAPKTASVDQLYNHFANQLQIPNNETDIDMFDKTDFINLLKLDAKLSDDAVYAAVKEAVANMAEKDEEITNLKAELKKLEDEKSAAKTAEIKAALDTAEKDGKIDNAQRKIYEDLAKTEPESVLNLLGAATPRQPITKRINNATDRKTGVEGRESWTFDDYHKKDPKALAKMKEEDPEAYTALFDAKFGE